MSVSMDAGCCREDRLVAADARDRRPVAPSVAAKGALSIARRDPEDRADSVFADQ
jgi:hypothetical protein